MPRGSKPGERRGGRQKGTPNKDTLERIEQAAAQAGNVARNNKKQAKEILDDLMQTAVGLAANFQKPIAEAIQAGKPVTDAELERFWKAMECAGIFAKYLAPFQSPTFRAIAVVAPPPAPPGEKINPLLQKPGGNVTTIDDPAALMRVYKSMLKGAQG